MVMDTYDPNTGETEAGGLLRILMPAWVTVSLSSEKQQTKLKQNHNKTCFLQKTALYPEAVQEGEY